MQTKPIQVILYSFICFSFNIIHLYSYKMTSALSRGSLIVFEGIDRCGKTTQCNLLTDYLKSKVSNAESTKFIRFPNRTSTIGTLINSYLASGTDIDDHTIHLLFSSNRWEQREEILQNLNNGVNLVCDRYAHSGVAFTSAKGLNFDWCMACDRGLPKPDCIIYLDMPVDAAAKRGDYGNERYEKIEFQKVVREKFMKLKEFDESQNNIPWHVVDASRSIEDIHNELKQLADKIILDSKSKPIGNLWS